jgi:hypothetical protein
MDRLNWEIVEAGLFVGTHFVGYEATVPDGRYSIAPQHVEWFETGDTWFEYGVVFVPNSAQCYPGSNIIDNDDILSVADGLVSIEEAPAIAESDYQYRQGLAGQCP